MSDPTDLDWYPAEMENLRDAQYDEDRDVASGLFLNHPLSALTKTEGKN